MNMAKHTGKLSQEEVKLLCVVINIEKDSTGKATKHFPKHHPGSIIFADEARVLEQLTDYYRHVPNAHAHSIFKKLWPEQLKTIHPHWLGPA